MLCMNTDGNPNNLALACTRFMDWISELKCVTSPVLFAFDCLRCSASCSGYLEGSG